MSDTKFCKDCRFYVAPILNLSWKFARCTVAPVEPPNLVTGEPAPLPFCEETRSSERSCGPDAKWFEPREPEQVAA